MYVCVPCIHGSGLKYLCLPVHLTLCGAIMWKANCTELDMLLCIAVNNVGNVLTVENYIGGDMVYP